MERWFAELTNKQLRRGVHRSVAQLKAAIRDFIAAHHAAPKPFVWTKSADEILASIARFAQRTLDPQAAPLIARTTRTGHEAPLDERLPGYTDSFRFAVDCAQQIYRTIDVTRWIHGQAVSPFPDLNAPRDLRQRRASGRDESQ